MRFFARQDPAHCETSELLPWLLNGTLDDAERGRVERHVAECVQCRRELVREREFSQAVIAVQPEAAWAPSFARVASRIGATERAGRQSPGPWRNLFAAWMALSPWLRAGFVAQFALTCVLAVALYLQVDDVPAYRTLGAAASAVTGETIIVVFDPAAREREIRQTLLGARARVIGGPSPEGAYTLSVPAADAAAVLARLRQAAVVRFAQPGPEPIEAPR